MEGERGMSPRGPTEIHGDGRPDRRDLGRLSRATSAHVRTVGMPGLPTPA